MRRAILILLLAGCARAPKEFPGFSLPDIDGHAEMRKGCATERCVYMYVAPWCHYCNEAKPTMMGLRDWLNDKGIETHVIVGQDSRENCLAYARSWGPGTLIDPTGRVRVGGLPHFITTDQAGNKLYRRAGSVSFTGEIGEQQNVWMAASIMAIDRSSLEARDAVAAMGQFRDQDE